MSGFRNQTVKPLARSVDDCCFACEAERACKAWTFDTVNSVCFVFTKSLLPRTAFYQARGGYL